MALRVTIDENDFKVLVNEIESQEGYRKPIGFGIARVDRGQLNPEKILQATFPVINWNENFGSAAILIGALQESGVEVDFTSSEFVYDVKKKFIKHAMNAFTPYLNSAFGEAHKNVQVIKTLDWIAQNEEFKKKYRVVFLFEDDKPLSPEAVYLKLYALSTGKAPLRSVNLTGAFGVLENVAWSFGQPLELDWLRMHEIEMKLLGEYPLIESVDKFPRFLSHIIPANNTRILDTSKVRMGAQLHAGTTIMPGASYVNFNAGTTGAVMVEGRISSSVVVGRGSDVGGGASILGVLSGTNGNPVSIGENTLLGANSVTGIPLGDGCIVDAGIAILEGTKIGMSATDLAKIAEANPKAKLKKAGKEEMVFFKGLELAGLHGIHFRQNSVNGMIIATRSKREIKLNSELH
ncbi:MAG: tetrahydrodipicolinate N-succinyltransferase N-terminal domain-containing protein [Sulfurospirillum sp.]|jgi:2,3,4,5-tetrahydropyridine-2-carboxylate N-succinyltransferase|nr:tetrahydrodipicolinate N-succinyltransferase N-terminal domain-containing protein [Sulfurospirillum sp.]MBP9491719.1 tetrahydrodipicolinate N-succinyltransferase N-terminal domain-containing protein [Sulfurospirillum sp.]MBP9611948.1 tetrahydrodipicolinate N-succinyltransferase N-terminal domain-containing protein [Sulfurospirillum sp.]